MKWTQVRISTITKEKMKKIKIAERESYDEIINRLLKRGEDAVN